jgi:hypothetical protein
LFLPTPFSRTISKAHVPALPHNTLISSSIRFLGRLLSVSTLSTQRGSSSKVLISLFSSVFHRAHAQSWILSVSLQLVFRFQVAEIVYQAYSAVAIFTNGANSVEADLKDLLTELQALHSQINDIRFLLSK